MRTELLFAIVVGFFLGWQTATGDKTQAVRAVDVLVIGPGLVVAMLMPRLPGAMRLAIAAVAGATVGYNLRNFLLEQEREQAPPGRSAP